MSGRNSTGDNRRVPVRDARAHRPRSGPHLGPFRITPARVVLMVAFAGGLGFLAYSIIVRDQLQIPLMASGFAIVGLVFVAAAVMAAANVIRAGRDGRDGTAVMTSLLGGLLAIAAFLSFAAAMIMGLIWGGTATP
ncbi:MAG: hypothetical protein A2V85_13825 [Chloroflexi bacterium RBG_16_72_14]|nr:MAG: hypothetical protein A2V85_13825 [Chloroflexi bacterium RBG_16_72_14]